MFTRSTVKIAALTFTTMLYGFSATASGFPDYIKGAEIEADELDIQYQLVSTKDKKAKKDHKTKQKIEAYYGLNDNWLILGGAKFGRDYKNTTDLNNLYFGGAYQFIDAAEYGFNASVLAEYIHAVDGKSTNELEYRLQLDKKWGPGKKLKTKANITFQNEFGDRRESGTEFITRVSTAYKLKSWLQPAIEWHAGYGKIDNIGSFDSEQEHYVGPALYGEFPLFAHGGELEYQIAYLPGITEYASDQAYKFLLEYEYNF